MVALLSLIVAPVITFIAWNQGHARDVERRVEKIRKAGQPVTLDELNQYYRLPDGTADTTQLWLDGVKPLATQEFNDAAKDIPVVGSGGELPRPGQPWPEMKKAEALLEQYAESLSLFHQAAEQGGAARFPIDLREGFTLRLDHVQNLRGAIRLLKVEAYVRGHHGDAAGCTSSIHTMFAVRRSLQSEPLLVSNLVCIAIYSIIIDTLGDTITTVPFSDQDLESFQRELRKGDPRVGLKNGLIGERVMGYANFQNPQQVQEFTESPVRIPAFKSDMSMTLEIYEDYLAALDQDYLECRQAAALVENKIRQTAGEPVGKLGHVYTLLLTPAVGASFDATVRAAADGRIGDAAIAVTLFHRKHRRLPKTLDELVPDFLPTVPKDPFNGQPLRYEVRSDGFVIYSVGRDGKDDGGTITDARLDEVIFVPKPHTN